MPLHMPKTYSFHEYVDIYWFRALVLPILKKDILLPLEIQDRFKIVILSRASLIQGEFDSSQVILIIIPYQGSLLMLSNNQKYDRVIMHIMFYKITFEKLGYKQWWGYQYTVIQTLKKMWQCLEEFSCLSNHQITAYRYLSLVYVFSLIICFSRWIILVD